ncbi:MAG: type II secretion system minor pseudopilin GspK [Thiobacillaceae bacterium]|nr:type II secretion system minor pseudopilin GspK [Thiobacillaceae bacterium]
MSSTACSPSEPAASALRERGVALVTVLLIVAIAAALSAQVLWRGQVWARQVENLRNAAQAEAIAQGALAWVGLILADDRGRGAADHTGEAWAMPVTVPVEHGQASGRLRDAQGCFNLNNLVANGQVSPADLEAYRRLLTLLDLDPALAEPLLDWLDADAQPTGEVGAEDAWYLQQDPPRHAANLPLAEVGELAQVRGYDADTIARLAPYVCALPEPTPVNVNTAPAEVLMAYLPGLDANAAQRLLPARGEGYAALEALQQRLAPEQWQGAQSQRLAVGSRYFLLDLQLSFGAVQHRYRALLMRSEAGAVQTVWLRRG